MDKTIDYVSGNKEEVFRYSEAYWVPVYEGEGTKEISYYAVVAGGAFENAGEAKIYPAEVYGVIEKNKKISDYKEKENFNVKSFIQI